MIIDFGMRFAIPKGCHKCYIKPCHPFGIIDTQLDSVNKLSQMVGAAHLAQKSNCVKRINNRVCVRDRRHRAGGCRRGNHRRHLSVLHAGGRGSP